MENEDRKMNNEEKSKKDEEVQSKVTTRMMRKNKDEKIKKIVFLVITMGIVGGLMWVISMGLNDSKTKKSDSDTSDETVVEAQNRKIAYVNKNAGELDIERAPKGTVNVYMFWGNGCPHCKAQWEYIESIRKKYPNEFKVYGFEVWNNKRNLKLGNKFAKAMGGEEIKSVPYTVIGDQTFDGFSDGEKLLDAILKAKDKKTDIYFDKIDKE